MIIMQDYKYRPSSCGNLEFRVTYHTLAHIWKKIKLKITSFAWSKRGKSLVFFLGQLIEDIILHQI